MFAFAVLDLVLCVAFILVIGNLYSKEYGEPLTGHLNLSLLANYSIFNPIFKVNDKFLDFKTNIVIFGVFSFLLKGIYLLIKIKILYYAFLFILLFMIFSYGNLYKQRQLTIKRDKLDGHECNCAYPVLKATKYVLIFKVIIYILFAFS
nr:MAG TPA: hypothetical protein [Caudoviricetes sp.]